MVVDTDHARFEQLFTEHYAAVVRYAARRVGLDAAHEVVAETFLVAWRRLDDVPAHALPWLYGAARRVVANELRRRARASRLTDRVADNAELPVFDPSDRVVGAVAIQSALEQLPARDREVVLLAEWEQLSGAEIAAALGCSQAAVRVRLHRARRRLAGVLGPAATTDQPAAAVVPRGGTA